ncbi:MAG: endolytic transglycosylase MltG [Flavisolibacter sp.]
MKKLVLVVLILLIVAAGILGWVFLGPATGFSSSKKILYIRTEGATKEAVLDSLKTNKIISNNTAFNWLANRMDLWKNLKPGRYDIKKGSSLLSIVRMLHSGRQTPVNLVITKIRTKEDLARLVGNKFECDSLQFIRFLNSNDSLAPFKVDTLVAMSAVLPDTYTYFWTATPSLIFRKFYETSKNFWTEERKKKAEAHGLTPLQAYILASIVEEETTNNLEKDTIASVYLNRYNKGMPLQADPTLKFAVRDFSIKWIHGNILDIASPYNTYKNKGFPPGPICTPSKKTIDAVLAAPPTPYYYFVANTRLNGHLFSESFEEHVKKAQAYREEDKKRREASENKTVK